MKHPVGFFPGPQSEDTVTQPQETAVPAPKASLVCIRFEDFPKELTYFNHRFALEPGDVVYVSGKLAGKPGVVVSVTTKFRIHTKDYEQVLMKLDLGLQGTFHSIAHKMVCYDPMVLLPDRFRSWVQPPQDPRKKKDPQDTWEDLEDVITGEGYSLDLHDMGSCPDLTAPIVRRGADYCSQGRVRYLHLRQQVGCAFIEGTRWYQVDFRLEEDGTLSELYCDCPYPGLCKHLVAVALTLNTLRDDPKFCQDADFVALDPMTFWNLASRQQEITL